MIKLKVREQCLKYAADRKANMLRKEEELEKRINILQTLIESEVTGEQEKVDASREQEVKKKDLERIIEYRTKGAILRSKCRWHNEGEKNTKYFLNLEISQLKIGENRFVTSDKDILKECENFYRNLYCSRTDTDYILNNKSFFENSTKKALDNDARQTGEGLLTKPECLQALKNTEPDKTPGSDGLPANFYKVFWNDISVFLVNAINYAFDRGQLSVSQRRGIIKLIPKKDSDPE